MSKYVSKLSKVGISLFAAFCMMACHTGEIDHNYENMVYVNQNSLNLFFGDTEQLTASPTESTFEWTSEDPSVATVNNEGLVTATARRMDPNSRCNRKLAHIQRSTGTRRK